LTNKIHFDIVYAISFFINSVWPLGNTYNKNSRCVLVILLLYPIFLINKNNKTIIVGIKIKMFHMNRTDLFGEDTSKSIKNKLILEIIVIIKHRITQSLSNLGSFNLRLSKALCIFRIKYKNIKIPKIYKNKGKRG
jgi:hypothetical protein